MTSEEIVRERYPDAEAQHHDAVYEMGRKAPIQEAHWAIYPAGGLGHQAMATGPTIAAAWNTAAEKVLQGLRKPHGLRIKREKLDDAGKVGAGALPVDLIEAALGKGEEVIVEEMNGAESVLERGEGGKYKTKPRTG